MNHVMLDIETMGTGYNAPITSIGAVFFDPKTGQIGETFYSTVSLEEEMKLGAVPDAPTIVWWLNQSKDAQQAMLLPPAFQDPLNSFNNWVKDESPEIKNIKVWGNGPVFDNQIIRAAFERRNIKHYFRFSRDRDVRTLIELGYELGYDYYKQPFTGERHNALDDAIHQAKCVSEIYQLIFNK